MQPALTFHDVLEDRAALAERFRRVRSDTIALTAGLAPEDMQVQSMPDASPTKWHLAHTTWFFEAFVLAPHARGYTPFDATFGFLFNSYYEALGARWRRPERGLLSRPLHAEILAYRQAVEEAILALIAQAGDAQWRRIAPLIELGLHHEQQHQELICTDIKTVLALAPEPHAAFPAPPIGGADRLGPAAFVSIEGGLVEIGWRGDGFAYDNEGPRHQRFLYDFEIAARPVTNGEFRAFVEDGGYDEPRWWLSDGWAAVQAQGWRHPLYWRREDGVWREVALHGLTALCDEAPVCHVSGFEAAAFAAWAGARLPSEAELELLAMRHPARGDLMRAGASAHPSALRATQAPQAVLGGVWEWSASAYEPYPGYAPPAGAVGEYNGKFMSQQLVLRGGSCVTPADHIRPTYRNFFPPHARWQFSGLRLARPLKV